MIRFAINLNIFLLSKMTFYKKNKIIINREEISFLNKMNVLLFTVVLDSIFLIFVENYYFYFIFYILI
jgi:hypothetical protein